MKKLLSIIGAFILTTNAYAEPIELNERYAGVFTSTPGCSADLTYNFANAENLTAARLYVSTSAQNPTSLTSAATLSSSSIDVGNLFEPADNAFVDIPLTGPLTLTLKDHQCGKDGAEVNIPFDLMLTKVPVNQVSVTGVVTDKEKTPVNDAVVSFYDTAGRFVTSAKTSSLGGYSVTVPKGVYNIATSKGATSTWYSGGLRGNASAVKVIANYKRNLRLDPVSPHVESVSTSTLVKGALLTISGTNFGTDTGDVDFNGYVTGTATYVTSWTDNAITIKTPSGAVPGCLRVVNKYAGPSNCVEMQ